MAIFDIFKKQQEQEKERYDRKQKKTDTNGDKIETEKEVKKEVKKATKKEEKKALSKASTFVAPEGIQPHLTEKATLLSENGVYVFKVKPGLNKSMVDQIVRKTYKVSPVKINIINASAKKRRVRGKVGIKKGFKKALVYLKKGEKIEI